MLIQHTGVTVHKREEVTPGYTLYATMASNQVYLIDLDGNIIKQWETAGGSTNTCNLLPNGNLFVLERSDGEPLIKVAASGRIREYDPAGKIVWEHTDHQLHHDARRLPNGGAVYLAWEMLDPADAAKVQGGVLGTEHHSGGIVGEVVREVDQFGEVVWEWRSSSLDFDKHILHKVLGILMMPGKLKRQTVHASLMFINYVSKSHCRYTVSHFHHALITLSINNSYLTGIDRGGGR